MMKKKFTFFLICAVLIFVLLSNATAQTISVNVSSVQFDGENYIIKGTIEASNLNPEGQLPESDIVTIYADILKEKDGVFPTLPDSLWITKGEVKNGKVLTEEELNGKHCTTLSLWSWTVRVDAWKEGAGEKDGHFYFDASKMKSSYKKEFVITIPKQYANSTVRIRAFLNHSWGGPFAAWPAFSYHHTIIYQGKLKNIAGKRKETVEQAKKTAKEKVLSILKNMTKSALHNSKRKNQGMHIFPEPKKITPSDEYKKQNQEKLDEFAKKNKIKKVEIVKADGETKSKIPEDDPTLKDKLKYYGGKLGGTLAGLIPGGSAISTDVENKVSNALGLGDIKKTQIELKVDPLAASLYNKFNAISERENKYSHITGIIKTISSIASKIYDSTIGKLGTTAKQRLAISYELEYAETVKKLKSGIPIETIKNDIENDGVIITEYQQIKAKAFVKENPSKIANNCSKPDFKDPVKRFEFYVKLAKEKGDIK